ncbi:tyrosine-type recombinase/integrase [Oceanobacillus picturae]|uniref:tyrosine-type recombinase/integrase n=1 Tax=Oceanobacillus picturae TaxID=171693 RepID=UPI001EE7612D|nr:tyrosine-type recombinase/integrase [Oceanobacillus picturae]
MSNIKPHYNIFVEIAKEKNDIRYMITENGIPIQDACLWLDLNSINSYLTGERYAYALSRYFRFLKSNGLKYQEVTNKSVIEEYIKDLLGLGARVIDYESRMTFTALNTYITVLKSFYRWLEDERKVAINPVLFSGKSTKQTPMVNTKLLYGQIWRFDIEESILSRVTYRRKRNHLKWYSVKEITEIKGQLPTLRDQTVFTISVETGMRIGEILGLKIENFDPFEPSLEIVRDENTENRARAKTMERTVHIYNTLADMLQTYINTERAKANILNSNYLFLNHKGVHQGNPLKPRNFLSILKVAGERAGLSKDEIRTHSGRSTRAQELIELMREQPELGITPTFIDEELGWKSERSIKVYEKGYSRRQKKKILERIEPIILNKIQGGKGHGNN